MFRLNSKWGWFLAYTAAFAALAGFVFWGTWSPDVAPVMPDSPINYPAWNFADFWARWTVEGRFIPNDLVVFLGSPYFWQELNYAIPMYVSGLAVAFFLRGRGLARFVAYSSGLLLAFCGYWCTLFSAGHGSWFFLMTYILWPFGLIDRAIRKNRLRNWLLLGATVGWAAYWQPDIWLLFMLFISCFFVYVCIRERKWPAWKGVVAALLVFAAIGGGGVYHSFVFDLKGREEQIASGQTVPERNRGEDDPLARWIFVTNWSLPPDETAEFAIPRINGDTSCQLTLAIGSTRGSGVRPYAGALGRAYGAKSGNYRQHSLYVGFVTCLLAVFALAGAAFDRRRSADIWFFAAAGLVFWLFSLGRHCEPVYRLVYALPFGDTLRAPVKWHHLTEFCIVILAGFGLARLAPFAVRRFGKWGKAALLVLVLVGVCDLARVDHLYCAPVNVAEARAQNKDMQFARLRRGDFAVPQVAAAVKSRQIVSVARPAPDLYLVGVLKPWGEPRSAKPLGTAAWLGVLSMLSGLLVGAYAVWKS